MSLTRRAALAAALAVPAARARAAGEPVEIDLFFPVPVQGKLATEMQRLVGQFNDGHPQIKVTPVYTGSYDDTNLKTRAAIAAGKPPAAVIMSANFIREYAIDGAAIALDPLMEGSGESAKSYMDRFWPSLRLNAMEQGRVYGVPFQNSTPLLYCSVDAFKEAGLDPEQPPRTWQEWLVAMRKIAKPDGSRYGLVMPGTYDYCGWLASALVMSNGGQYYNADWGGEVFYDDQPATAALTFLHSLVHKHKVMPAGVLDANACTSAFFAGRAGMMLLSTGALGFVTEGMKTPFKTAFVPANVLNAAPIGGASLIIPKGNGPERQAAAWTLITWLTSPEIAGGWSRFTGYFAPNRAAYELAEMKAWLAEHPNAAVALEQLNRHGRGWFATYRTVPVRKAMEDQIQALLNGRVEPATAAAEAQRAAEILLRPYVAQTAMKLPV